MLSAGSQVCHRLRPPFCCFTCLPSCFCCPFGQLVPFRSCDILPFTCCDFLPCNLSALADRLPLRSVCLTAFLLSLQLVPASIVCLVMRQAHDGCLTHAFQSITSVSSDRDAQPRSISVAWMLYTALPPTPPPHP